MLKYKIPEIRGSLYGSNLKIPRTTFWRLRHNNNRQIEVLEEHVLIQNNNNDNNNDVDVEINYLFPIVDNRELMMNNTKLRKYR